MIAPYDIMWNGKLYPAGKAIPATQKKLIASLAISTGSAAISEAVEGEPVADEPVDETPATTKAKK